jgi:signal peptidase I
LYVVIPSKSSPPLHTFPHSYPPSLHQCMGPSMLPTFNINGDVAVTDLMSVKLHKIQVGDVVIAKSAQNPKQQVCKRVLGMEGDTLVIASSQTEGGPRVITVPKGHVWLQGDNFHNSTDSRHYGPVPYTMLLGRVWAKVWPLHEARWIDRNVG